jgi:hypothetical protein
MDIAFAVSMAASKAARCPKTSWYMITRILKYLSTNRKLSMKIQKENGPLTIRCFTDASWAPGNDRSQSGVVICLGETPILWKSSRQHLTAMSSAEAELIAVTQGFQYTMGVEAVVACAGLEIPVTLYTDNTPALITIKDNKFKWRSRYYSVRAARIREVIDRNEMTIEFVPGTNMIADILTKYTNRLTIVHCLKLTSHRQKVNSEWRILDEKVLKNKAMNTGEHVLYPRALEYETVPENRVTTLYCDGQRPTCLIMTKTVRLRSHPDSGPCPIPEGEEKVCWRAGPFGIWTPPRGQDKAEWIYVPRKGRGKMGVSEWGKKGVFLTNPTSEDGTWKTKTLPLCPYCGNPLEDSYMNATLPDNTCRCQVSENEKGWVKKLPHWPQGKGIVAKILTSDLENYDYETNLPNRKPACFEPREEPLTREPERKRANPDSQ